MNKMILSNCKHSSDFPTAFFGLNNKEFKLVVFGVTLAVVHVTRHGVLVLVSVTGRVDST
jgi:hypothetical protein